MQFAKKIDAVPITRDYIYNRTEDTEEAPKPAQQMLRTST
jgi:hypothetical protein